MSIGKAESEMRDLAYIADTGDGAEHFKSLTDFRRVLALLHKPLCDAQDAFRISAQAELHECGLVLLRNSKNKSQQPIEFLKSRMESLQGLHEELGAIKEDSNEEIQLAIGSVQVHDAQIMKKQTTWTVVLNTLAAIYLPMTLVTGIFGMNITENSSESTAPGDWWALGAFCNSALVNRCDTRHPFRLLRRGETTPRGRKHTVLGLTIWIRRNTTSPVVFHFYVRPHNAGV